MNNRTPLLELILAVQSAVAALVAYLGVEGLKLPFVVGVMIATVAAAALGVIVPWAKMLGATTNGGDSSTGGSGSDPAARRR